jgi:hypothetical protein
MKVPASNPADYIGVLSALHRQIERAQHLREHEFNVFLGSGTPQMNVASILLCLAGVIKGRLRQVVDPEMRAGTRLDSVPKSAIVDVDFDPVFSKLFKALPRAPELAVPNAEFGPSFSLAKHIDAYEKSLLWQAVAKIQSEGKRPTKSLVHRECFGADNGETIRRKLTEIWED